MLSSSVHNKSLMAGSGANNISEGISFLPSIPSYYAISSPFLSYFSGMLWDLSSSSVNSKVFIWQLVELVLNRNKLWLPKSSLPQYFPSVAHKPRASESSGPTKLEFLGMELRNLHFNEFPKCILCMIKPENLCCILSGERICYRLISTSC